jgi:hypothetical protein
MRRARVTGLVTLLSCLLGPLTARAQEPPAHFPACSTDSIARMFLARVHYLLSARETDRGARLDSLRLEPIPPDEAALVTEEPVCLAAASAYAAVIYSPGRLRAPFPVMIVRAGPRYLVQLAGVTGREAVPWKVVVFDSVFRVLASY